MRLEQSGRALAAAFATVALLSSTSCSGAVIETELSGTVSGLAEEADSQPGRWLITIELEDGTIAQSTDVQIAFNELDMACDDGSGIVVPTSLSLGDRLLVQRRPNTEIDTMDPPIIDGERVTVLCSE